jgi:hypothetical protein
VSHSLRVSFQDQIMAIVNVGLLFDQFETGFSYFIKLQYSKGDPHYVLQSHGHACPWNQQPSGSGFHRVRLPLSVRFSATFLQFCRIEMLRAADSEFTPEAAHRLVCIGLRFPRLDPVPVRARRLMHTAQISSQGWSLKKETEKTDKKWNLRGCA